MFHSDKKVELSWSVYWVPETRVQNGTHCDLRPQTPLYLRVWWLQKPEVVPWRPYAGFGGMEMDTS